LLFSNESLSKRRNLWDDQAPLGRGVGCGVWGVGSREQREQALGFNPRFSRRLITFVRVQAPSNAGFTTPYALPPTPFFLTSQIRRAAVSIPANIAEGYGRRTRGEYIQFLYIAQGSLKELETHLILSKRIKLAEAQNIDPVLAQCQLVGRLLQGLIRSLENK
jgi:four helix bundle protein